MALRGLEALRANGISERAMRAWYRAVYPDVYIPRGAELNAAQRAHAAWLWSRRHAVIGGNSAAAVLGAKWVDPTRPAELVHTNRRPPPLVTVHSDTLLTGEVTERGGLPVTTPALTAFDIGRRMPALPAVQRLDALAHATDFKVVEVEAVIARHPGARGLVGLREVLRLVDGGKDNSNRLKRVGPDWLSSKPASRHRACKFPCSMSAGFSLRGSTWIGRSSGRRRVRRRSALDRPDSAHTRH